MSNNIAVRVAEALTVSAVEFDCIFSTLDAQLGEEWPVGIREDFLEALEELQGLRDDLILEISRTHDIQDPKQ